VKDRYKILIVEPSFIVHEGLSMIIESMESNLNIAITDSLHNSIKIPLDKSTKIILVNPVVFNNDQNGTKKFLSHFSNINMVGLITTQYDRNLCSCFVDCIYLNDERRTIISTITKYLAFEQEINNTINNSLSKREEDVLKLLASGKSNKEIAGNLFISIHTVITHRKNISNKLGVKSTAAMAIYAVANNIIDLNDSLKSIK